MRILIHAKRIYFNPFSEKSIISLENRDSSGVYALICMVTSKVYIGSSVKLGPRLLDYMQPAYLFSRPNSPLIKALVKYGNINFCFIILEICEPKEVLKREQYWIDLICPEYNLSPIAGSTLGVPVSVETRAKLRFTQLGKNHNEETRTKLREVALSRTKLHRPGFSLYIYDQNLCLLQECRSHREGMRYLGCDSRTIIRYLDKALFRGQYFLKSQLV